MKDYLENILAVKEKGVVVCEDLYLEEYFTQGLAYKIYKGDGVTFIFDNFYIPQVSSSSKFTWFEDTP